MVMGRDYHRNYSREYYRKRREKVFAMLGGKCAKCESVEQLQVDHVDITQKNFPLGKLLNYSWARIAEELKLCQLLCAACHLEKSKDEGALSRKHTNNWIERAS